MVKLKLSTLDDSQTPLQGYLSNHSKAGKKVLLFDKLLAGHAAISRNLASPNGQQARMDFSVSF